MKLEDLKTKKITKATFKTFVKKSNDLFIRTISNFSGMSDMVEQCENRSLIRATKEDLLKPFYVMIDRTGADSFRFIETPTHYGINVYNCCGSNDILTPKN